MAGTAVLDVIDALVEQYGTAVTTATVYDGVGASNDPGDFIMVGVSDPDSDQAPNSAETTSEWAGLGAKRGDEEGTVSCCVMSWNGEAEGLAEARAKVRTMLDTIAAVHVADPTLGIGPVMWTRFGSRGSTTQLQSDLGSMVLHYFEIAFKARI